MAVEVLGVITRVDHRSVHVQVIMYTTQGHCVGGEPHYIRCECREFALSVCDVNGRITTGLVLCRRPLI